MKKPIREISEQEIISLGQRIDQAVSLGQGSTPEDLPLLRDIFDTWWLIADEVKDETLTLKGLREIFGIIKEKLRDKKPVWQRQRKRSEILLKIARS